MKSKITNNWQFEATINEKVFRGRLRGTVWDVRLEVVSVWNKKNLIGCLRWVLWRSELKQYEGSTINKLSQKGGGGVQTMKKRTQKEGYSKCLYLRTTGEEGVEISVIKCSRTN